MVIVILIDSGQPVTKESDNTTRLKEELEKLANTLVTQKYLLVNEQIYGWVYLSIQPLEIIQRYIQGL